MRNLGTASREWPPFPLNREKEISETEKVRIREINEVTVTDRYMTIREWEVNA